MTSLEVAGRKQSVSTPSGRISYTEAGKGPVALFVHGVLVSSHLWRHQLEELSDLRRCIAVDLLAHGLRDTLNALLADKNLFRSADAMGPAFEHPELLTDETIEAYLRPLVRSEQRTRDLERFLAAFDCRHTVAVEEGLRKLAAPTLIVWGTDDIYFDVKWSRWLAETIPGTRKRVELDGARIFFPDERAARFNQLLREHWLSTEQ